ncbi:hypothetical protein PMAYCL1PPCAC_30129, partial [Pristionchus mayeri]
EGEEADVVVEDAAAMEDHGRYSPHLLHEGLETTHEGALLVRCLDVEVILPESVAGHQLRPRLQCQLDESLSLVECEHMVAGMGIECLLCSSHHQHCCLSLAIIAQHV